MSTTYAEALAALNDPQYQTVEGIKILVQKISVEVPGAKPGATTLLYSGMVGDTAAWEIAEGVGRNSGGQIVTIGETPVAKFLSSRVFLDALEVAAGSREMAKAVLDGVVNPDGTRTQGLWDVASRSLAEAATGDVKTLSPFADPSRVFAQTELPALLENTKVTSIDGIPRSQLLEFHNELLRLGPVEANRFVSDTVSISSRLNLPQIEVATQNGQIVWTDTSRWTGVAPGPAPLGTTVIDLGAIAGSLSIGDRLALTNILEIPGVNYAKYLETFSKTGSWLGTIGGVLAYGSLLKMAYDASTAVQAGDPITAHELVRDWCLGTVGAAVLGGMAFAGAAILLAPLAVLGTVGVGAAVVLSIGASILAAYWGHKGGVAFGEVISSSVNSLFGSALNWVPPRRDPLVLDLDGGGITTTGINPAAPILFDQDGDGTKTATGWIAAGEAIVVRDLNGNNLIDSGRELFGDNTLLAHGARAGQTAANGFEALADLDSDINGVADGKFDANDLAYNSVKLWKDQNQDGVSQSNELFTLNQLGVASIFVAGTTGNVNLVNGSGQATGNTQTFAGTFIKTTGAVGSAGTAQLAGSLLLAKDVRQTQSVSVSTTRVDGLIWSAFANLNKVPKLGERCPSSRREMKLRSRSASKASFSCDKPWARRNCRSTSPKASVGCRAEGLFMPSMVGNIG